MAVCVWNLHAAVCTMDHGDLILGDREAKDFRGLFRKAFLLDDKFVKLKQTIIHESVSNAVLVSPQFV